MSKVEICRPTKQLPNLFSPAMIATMSPPAHNHAHHPHACSNSHGQVTAADLAVLAEIMADSQPRRSKGEPAKGQRRPPMDPLILQTASLSGPGNRNHYMHGGLMYPHAQMYSRCDDVPAPGWGKISKPAVSSKQAPRHVHVAELQRRQRILEAKQSLQLPTETTFEQKSRRLSQTTERMNLAKTLKAAQKPLTPASNSTLGESSKTSANPPPLEIKCHARTRVPTPHGQVFLHVYKNNRDAKEHLAFVFDQLQLENSEEASTTNFIRSSSLDSVWRENETDEERIVRGAYVGRLSPSSSVASPATKANAHTDSTLVRIHSECFTGETMGSQRCDCGEQLDEAFRLISTGPAKRGVVVYLRQEGRGIGLLEKVRAYNLQDLGHDTVAANLLLGHGSDMRTYDLAAAILKDLGIEKVDLLTNNPDKVTQAESEGIQVAKRVPMVPRGWRQAADRDLQRSKRRHRQRDRARALAMKKQSDTTDYNTSETDSDVENGHMDRSAGVGMIGAGTTASSELDRYLRTKVEKMGHMLDLADSMDNLRTQPNTPDLSDGPELGTQPFRMLNSGKKKRQQSSLASSVESIRSTVDVDTFSEESRQSQDVKVKRGKQNVMV